MAELIIVVFIAFVVFFFLSGKRRRSKSARETPSVSDREAKARKVVAENAVWLEERWENARKERDAGALKTVPRWFFDQPTERQCKRLAEIGLSLKGTATKGEASDLIGLFAPPDEKDLEILRFFKVPTKGINQTKARHEVAKLFAHEENVQRWNARPASAMQKEFFRYFGLTMPSNLTFQQAEHQINEYLARLAEENEEAVDEWDAYQEIFEEINRPEFGEDYHIRRVCLPLYRSAMEELKREGESIRELADDFDRVVQKIIALNPGVQKT